MKIAVLSGKGGTGKTTVSTNLFRLLTDITLVDCDVEEPNGHLFIHPQICSKEAVNVDYPVIDAHACIHCRECAKACRYHAIIAGPKVTMPLKELCHNCGLCAMVCPEGAITYAQRSIGSIFEGTAGSDRKMLYGLLDTGELSGVKIINRALARAEDEPCVIIDSPPGTSCSTVAAVEDADFALIVTEPTPFGLSDMKMVVEMLSFMNISVGVVINKAGLGDTGVYDYCTEEGLDILGEIPFSREIAEACAEGKLIIGISQEYREIMQHLWDRIWEKAKNAVCTK